MAFVGGLWGVWGCFRFRCSGFGLLEFQASGSRLRAIIKERYKGRCKHVMQDFRASFKLLKRRS